MICESPLRSEIDCDLLTMEQIGTLTPTPPYNFPLILDVLSRYKYPSLDIAHDNAYWRVLRVDNALALIQVKDLGSVQSPALDVALVQTTGATYSDRLLAEVGQLLDVESDVSAFFLLAREHPVLWQVVEPLVGLRWLRTPTVFEALMSTVIEQQIAWIAAQKAQRWLVEWGGHCLHWDGRDYYAFPRPEQIASATIDQLRPLKITFKRMQVMIDVARQVINGELDLERLRQAPVEEGYKALVAIKGIGHWTAAWTLQRSKGWHNYVGHNDVALQAAVNHYFYGGEGRIPAQQVIDTFAPYGDYAGLAAHYTILRWVLDRYEQTGG
jgi:DNA-3-methyladenine glycosylase II